LLVAPRDVEGLAAAITRLAADPDLRRRLAECGRARCRERFRHERMTQRLRDLYQRVLAGEFPGRRQASW
jgi:glycosyltransferase involved in cell wall biosynthesis